MQSVFGTYEDLPLITSSQFMENRKYGYASYALPQFVYATLHHYLGKETFLEAFQTYIRRWAHKSPTPYDFFNTFEDVSGENLDWLWEPWFFRYGYADVTATAFENGQLMLENLRRRPVPITLDITYQDGRHKQITRNAKTWGENERVSLAIPRADEVKFIIINREVPDFDEMNNSYPSLEEVYTSLELDEAITVTYQVNEFLISAEISMKNGALCMEIRRAGLEAFLLPLENNQYETVGWCCPDGIHPV